MESWRATANQDPADADLDDDDLEDDDDQDGPIRQRKLARLPADYAALREAVLPRYRQKLEGLRAVSEEARKLRGRVAELDRTRDSLLAELHAEGLSYRMLSLVIERDPSRISQIVKPGDSV